MPYSELPKRPFIYYVSAKGGFRKWQFLFKFYINHTYIVGWWVRKIPIPAYVIYEWSPTSKAPCMLGKAG